MAYDKLKQALFSVDWNANVKAFLDDDISLAQKMAECNLRLAIWSKQFEEIDAGNLALPFIREMQLAGSDAVTLWKNFQFPPRNIKQLIPSGKCAKTNQSLYGFPPEYITRIPIKRLMIFTIYFLGQNFNFS